MRPPRLKDVVAIVFQCSISALLAALSSPAAAAAAWPSVALTTGMKALQLHQPISATTTVKAPMIVEWRCSPLKISRSATLLEARAFSQRSGSCTKKRTMKAAAAGSRPNRNT